MLSITAGSPTGPAAVSLASIAFAHGLAIAVMVAALGAVSGGHFNPAVTFGFVATGRMGVGRGLLYWAAQRAFGPALVSGHWANQLVYWAGPLLGGAVAGWVATGIFLEKAPAAAVAERGGPAPGEERGA